MMKRAENTKISIHKALAGLDLITVHVQPDQVISIHKALAGLDSDTSGDGKDLGISIHKALAGLDGDMMDGFVHGIKFQSTRPSRASTYEIFPVLKTSDQFQSTRPSRAST